MDTGDTNTAAAAYHYCAKVPAAARQTRQRAVSEFGAMPDDDRDDTEGLQRALDAMKAGDTLVLSPGRYLINNSIRMRRPGVTLTGPGATIHATNPDRQAVIIEADNSTVSSLTFTAVTEGRRSAPWHSRIAVYAESGDGNKRAIHNTVIRDNRIVNAGPPGSPTANSASAGGIVLHHADGFLVTGNTVARTLADGIHVTGGSTNGRILNNTVRETGDDMIAVVSYAYPRNATASSLVASWDTRVAASLVRNVLIAGNKVSGQYWGRGISVVGGQNITIASNTIDNVPHAAGILIAREGNWHTFGVENVLIENNVIRDVQTKSPPYDFQGKFASSSRSRTGHGAVEMNAALLEDEAAEPSLRESLAVRNVFLRGNTVERANSSGVRAGAGTGLIRNVGFTGNRFKQVNGDAVRVLSPELMGAGVYCSDNQRDGRSYESNACKRDNEPDVRGAALKCTAEGMLE